MKDEKKGMGCGTLLAVLLTVAFVVLRLCNVIDWSWWWVVSPVWIYAILWVVLIIVAAIFSD